MDYQKITEGDWKLILSLFKDTKNEYILKALKDRDNSPISLAELDRIKPACDTRMARHAYTYLASTLSARCPQFRLYVAEGRYSKNGRKIAIRHFVKYEDKVKQKQDESEIVWLRRLHQIATDIGTSNPIRKQAIKVLLEKIPSILHEAHLARQDMIKVRSR